MHAYKPVMANFLIYGITLFQFHVNVMIIINITFFVHFPTIINNKKKTNGPSDELHIIQVLILDIKQLKLIIKPFC